MSSTDTAVIAARPEYLVDLAAYREGLRKYLCELDDAEEWRSVTFGSAEEEMAASARLLRRLYDAGWNRYGWPEAIGGFGGGPLHRATMYEELTRAEIRCPAQHLTLEVLAPVLIHFAPEVAAKFIPSYLDGSEWWSQGFSEPEAGSDLAGLRTRAVEEESGDFVINGQKIWSSQGPTATKFMLLARTGPAESRHRGLTMFLIDADSPGITVRPISLASGRREVAEVFFDDVRVPADRVISEVGGGWAFAMYLMQFERGMYGYMVVNKLLIMMARLRREMMANGASAAERERFAQTYVSVLTAQARSAATVRVLATGTPLGTESSLDKLLFTHVEKEVNDLIMDQRRAWLIAGESSTDDIELDDERAEWWYSRTATIMGGTAQIQRGIIADHILGLPKEGQK